MFYEEIRTKQYLSNIILSIKDSLQQQIHYNGNIFGNKFCRRNKGSLYMYADSKGLDQSEHPYSLIQGLIQRGFRGLNLSEPRFAEIRKFQYFLVEKSALSGAMRGALLRDF